MMSEWNEKEPSSPIPGHAAEATAGVTRRVAVVAGAALAAASVQPSVNAAQPQEAPQRGSEKLLSVLAHKRGGISQDHVNALLKLLGRDTIKLVDWHILGTPVPEVITAVSQTSISAAAELVGSIYAANLRATITNFPNGLPAVDGVRVEVTLRN
jgi:hypothetical protein